MEEKHQKRKWKEGIDSGSGCAGLSDSHQGEGWKAEPSSSSLCKGPVAGESMMSSGFWKRPVGLKPKKWWKANGEGRAGSSEGQGLRELYRPGKSFVFNLRAQNVVTGNDYQIYFMRKWTELLFGRARAESSLGQNWKKIKLEFLGQPTPFQAVLLTT